MKEKSFIFYERYYNVFEKIRERYGEEAALKYFNALADYKLYGAKPDTEVVNMVRSFDKED